MSDIDVREITGMRMQGYYIGFDQTGHEGVDLLLSAIAYAGKMYHSTEHWHEEMCDRDYSCADLIQLAAKHLAAEIRAMERSQQ